MNQFIESKRQWLLEQIDPNVISLFRIVYGLFMAYEMIDYFRIGLIKNMFVLPAINFKYDYLGWLKPLPEFWLNIVLGVLLVCTVAITLGLFFKWACRLFAVGYLYLFLLDKSIYNNHIYLFILAAILFSFTDADRCLSIRKSPVPQGLVPRWQLFILQFQFVIVYFYGGIAKLTHDWLLRCQPVRFLVDNLSQDHFLSGVLKNEVAIFILNYGGLALDLLSPLLLWYKPIRRWAIFPFIIFHLTNSQIFTDIGIFPYLMLFGLLLFFDFGKFSANVIGKRKKPAGTLSMNKIRLIAASGHADFAFKYLLIPYFIFQLLFPLRGHFLPNELDWTTIGNRFSWRMKVDTRQIEQMSFTVFEPSSNQAYPIDIRTRVNDMQIMNLSMDPRSVAQFGRFLKTEALHQGALDPQIKASITLKYNGRPVQYFVTPETDMASVTYSPFTKLDWVLPVKSDK